MTDHLVGLLLGNEQDWPRTFELLMERSFPRNEATSGYRRAVVLNCRLCCLSNGAIARQTEIIVAGIVDQFPTIDVGSVPSDAVVNL